MQPPIHSSAGEEPRVPETDPYAGYRIVTVGPGREAPPPPAPQEPAAKTSISSAAPEPWEQPAPDPRHASAPPTSPAQPAAEHQAPPRPQYLPAPPVAPSPYAAPPAPPQYGAPQPPYGAPQPWRGHVLHVPEQWDPRNPTVGLADSGQRFLARFFDFMMTGLLWFLLMMVATGISIAIGGGELEGPAETFFMCAAVFNFFLFPVVWEWFQVSVWRRSLGKIILGLWVVRADGGGKVSAGRALLRALCFAPGHTNLVNLVLPWSLTNVLWHLRDKERRQCLHDKAAGTVVVKTVR
ncbi:RDD family protein [Nocardiopsis algeriensis]|uniref:RDD family protein n=1 Tax=Nocardiopsis algeriensis TaxID=1478215 RepID=UPI003B42B468